MNKQEADERLVKAQERTATALEKLAALWEKKFAPGFDNSRAAPFYIRIDNS